MGNNTMEQTVIEQIVDDIADLEGVKPENLSTALEHHIPTDVIRELANHRSNSWRLQFETQKHVVEITGNNIILVDGEPAETSF